MPLDPTYFGDASVHYFVPQPTSRENLLYYPISVGYFDCTPAYSLQRNQFSSYLLIVMLTGSLSYQTRRSRGIARAGNALLLDCNAPHAYTALGKCSFTFIHFDGAQSKALFDAIESCCGNLIHLPNPSELCEGIGELLATMKEARHLSETRASCLVYSLLMTLLEASAAPRSSTAGDPAVDSAIAYIQQHLTDKLSVEDIAASAGYSPSYFSHLFAAETGMSPYQFVVRSRVEHGQMLLKTTRASVQEIAFQCGFNSAANFCYTFRRMVGVPPHEYRKRPL